MESVCARAVCAFYGRALSDRRIFCRGHLSRNALAEMDSAIRPATGAGPSDDVADESVSSFLLAKRLEQNRKSEFFLTPTAGISIDPSSIAHNTIFSYLKFWSENL